MARIEKLDHVAIIVRDLDEALANYERLLGLRAARIEDYGPGVLRIAFLPVGETQIELIQPLRDDDPNGQWLRKHGEGIQHLAFRVDDLEESIACVRQRGGRLVTPAPLPGAGQTRIVFLDPGQLNGASVELCASTRGGGRSEGQRRSSEGGDSP